MQSLFISIELFFQLIIATTGKAGDRTAVAMNLIQG